jgi:glycine cleavage system aminomethyltransferase T
MAMSEPLPRQSALNDRHRALGSDLSQSWNDMPIPQFYATDPYAETTAVRSRAGLIDVSGLQIIDLTGPEATAMLNYLLTSDISTMKAGESHISNIVNEAGALIDDVLVYCDGPNAFRISHGGAALEPALAALGEGMEAAAAAARCGADHTATLGRAKAGRASYINPEQLLGHVDPGAEAVARGFVALSGTGS